MTSVSCFTAIVGIRVDVTTKDGQVATGLLTHASLEKRYDSLVPHILSGIISLIFRTSAHHIRHDD